jgi:hypothetical protein
MKLINELQERWKAIFLEREIVEKRADELAEDMQELEVALVALQGLHAPIADEQPELFDEPQEIEASSQSESCVPSLGAETDLQTSPGEAEESRDQFEEEATRAAAIELTADVEPVPEPYRVTADVDDKPLTADFATLHEATECLEELSLRSASRAELQVLHEGENGEQAWVSHIVREFPASEPLPEPEWNEPQPTEGYAPVTNPEAHIEAVEAERYAQPTNPDADAIARAHDYYSPENVEKRNRFNPWGGVSHLFGKSKVDA